MQTDRGLVHNLVPAAMLTASETRCFRFPGIIPTGNRNNQQPDYGTRRTSQGTPGALTTPGDTPRSMPPEPLTAPLEIGLEIEATDPENEAHEAPPRPSVNRPIQRPPVPAPPHDQAAEFRGTQRARPGQAKEVIDLHHAPPSPARQNPSHDAGAARHGPTSQEAPRPADRQAPAHGTGRRHRLRGQGATKERGKDRQTPAIGKRGEGQGKNRQT